MGEGDSSLMGAIHGHIGCRGDVVKKVTTNAIKQEIYDLWLGGATTYCGVAASKFDRNWIFSLILFCPLPRGRIDLCDGGRSHRSTYATGHCRLLRTASLMEPMEPS